MLSCAVRADPAVEVVAAGDEPVLDLARRSAAAAPVRDRPTDLVLRTRDHDSVLVEDVEDEHRARRDRARASTTNVDRDRLALLDVLDRLAVRSSRSVASISRTLTSRTPLELVRAASPPRRPGRRSSAGSSAAPSPRARRCTAARPRGAASPGGRAAARSPCRG